MERCASCGAALAAGAAWCGQCFAPRTQPATAMATAPVAVPPVPQRHVPVAAPEPVVRRTRWAKTDTTFGPVGRVVATGATLLPLGVFFLGGLYSIAGGIIYLAFIVPWAMRDIWKPGLVRIG